MRDIKLLNLQDIKEIVNRLNEPDFRAKQIYKWLWKKNIADFSQMTDLPKQLREKLAEQFFINKIKIHSTEKSKDGTIKYAFKLYDGLLIEGVLIPDGKRVTACISTQVGCPLGCKFCATGAMGFKRNLSFGEIYDQAFILNEQSISIFNRPLTNIVVMGMGEPLLNMENTLKAIALITSNHGMGLSPQRITLSTVGIVKKLKQLADLKPKFNLAISLHTAINKKRSTIMPINITNPLDELIDALKYYYKRTQKRITIEYLLIDGITDTIADAKALAAFCKNFPVKINLIEYNPNDFVDFRKSSVENTKRFYNFLKSKNLVVTIRKSRGQDINAACGQLIKKQSKIKIKPKKLNFNTK